MIVKITEVDPICAMQACMDGFEVVSPYLDGVNTGDISCIDTRLMGTTDIIVTTTGNTDVCDANMLKTIKKGAVVCNIGHFDTEIDTAFMREKWAWEEVKPQVHKVFRDTKAGDSPDLDSGDYINFAIRRKAGKPWQCYRTSIQNNGWLFRKPSSSSDVFV